MNLKEKTDLTIKHIDYLSGHDDAAEKEVADALTAVRDHANERLKKLGDDRAEREVTKAANLQAKIAASQEAAAADAGKAASKK